MGVGLDKMHPSVLTILTSLVSLVESGSSYSNNLGTQTKCSQNAEAVRQFWQGISSTNNIISEESLNSVLYSRDD